VQVIREKKVLNYKRRENETPEKFQWRVLSQPDDCDPMDDKGGKMNCYFGNIDNIPSEEIQKWEKNSVIVAKADPKGPSNIIWTSDPYSILN
jgi:hypothetical protein